MFWKEEHKGCYGLNQGLKTRGQALMRRPEWCLDEPGPTCVWGGDNGKGWLGW